jgi:hypothetical protein
LFINLTSLDLYQLDCIIIILNLVYI